MAESGTVKNYQKDKLTIHWEASKCHHAAECVKGLGSVFNPNARPWINTDAATAEDIAKTIDKCPSGALSYTWEGQEKADTSNDGDADSIRVQVMPNGPALIRGNVTLELPDGSSESKSGSTAICRCGASSKKPFCDGSHQRIGFEG